MKRIQLFEFEDFDWLPEAVRAGVTSLIVVFHRMMGTREVLAGLIGQVRNRCDFSQIVDMGSGSGGIMPEVLAHLNDDNPAHPIRLLLTDLHPNPEIVRTLNNRASAAIRYHPQPVDATDLSQTPPGLKTMISSFHHLPPKKAKEVFRSARDHKAPLFIYEVAENAVPTLLWWLLLPLSLSILFVMVLFMTPFVRPLSWKQLVLTYLIPIIPVVYAWDGQASLVRTYTFEDVDELLSDIRSDGYSWEVAPAKKANGKKLGYYILGFPLAR